MVLSRELHASADHRVARWLGDVCEWAQAATSTLCLAHPEVRPGDDLDAWLGRVRWLFRSIVHRARLIHDRPTFMITGAFSAGKTSFINATVRCEDFLPTSLDERTAIPTLVARGDAPRELHLPVGDGYVPVGDEVASRFFGLTPRSLDDDPLLRSLVRSSRPVRVTTNRLPPRLDSVELLDLPGLGSAFGGELPSPPERPGPKELELDPDDPDDALVYEFFVESDHQGWLEAQHPVFSQVDPDIVLWLCDARQGLTRSALRVLKALHAIDPDDEILVVLTKADRLVPSELEQQREATAKQLERAGLAQFADHVLWSSIHDADTLERVWHRATSRAAKRQERHWDRLQRGLLLMDRLLGWVGEDEGDGTVSRQVLPALREVLRENLLRRGRLLGLLSESHVESFK